MRSRSRRRSRMILVRHPATSLALSASSVTALSTALRNATASRDPRGSLPRAPRLN
ncbi:hypothetical protein GTW71_10400 [Streptomyces sp. SID6041]|nr:hypothetical protein [Streptomyces sp. SID6041]